MFGDSALGVEGGGVPRHFRHICVTGKAKVKGSCCLRLAKQASITRPHPQRVRHSFYSDTATAHVSNVVRHTYARQPSSEEPRCTTAFLDRVSSRALAPASIQTGRLAPLIYHARRLKVFLWFSSRGRPLPQKVDKRRFGSCPIFYKINYLDFLLLKVIVRDPLMVGSFSFFPFFLCRVPALLLRARASQTGVTSLCLPRDTCVCM